MSNPDPNNIYMNKPKHVAIIMDGNGRWAKSKNLPRIMGHRAGAKTVDVMIQEAIRLDIKAVTLYTFSSENWKRAAEEVSALMLLLKKSITDNKDKFRKNNIKFNVIGRLEGLPKDVQAAVNTLVEETKGNTKLTLSLALNYGSRQEILDAVKKITQSGVEVENLTEKDFSEYLYTSDLPELDLIIRTSGEFRLSNFLLWQAAYAEIHITKTLWPAFTAGEFSEIIEEFSNRERRYGA